MKLTIIIIYFFTLIFILNTDLSALLQLSFLINLSVFSYLILQVQKRNEFNPFFLATHIFFYLFFIIAPITQLSNNSNTLISGLTFDTSSAVYANFIIGLFYICLYFFFRYVFKTSSNSSDLTSLSITNNTIAPILLLLSIVITGGCLPYAISLMSDTGNRVEDKTIMLIVSKFIMMIPFGILLRLFTLKGQKGYLSYYFFITLNIICVIIIQNPLIQKRNAIGPIYLTICYFFFEKRAKNNTFFFISVFTLFVVLFPLSSLLTHTSGTLDSRVDIFFSSLTIDSVSNIISSHFLELHYDAWGVVVTTVEYVKAIGLSYGWLLLGSIFFFIPRAIWATKPYGTGNTIVEEFVYSRGSEFTNISSPFVSEGYVNFGLIGVILFACFLAYYFRKKMNEVNMKDHNNRYKAVFFSFYLFFLLRGDLQNGIAFYIGFLAACSIADKLALWVYATTTRSVKHKQKKYNTYYNLSTKQL